jgi:hypothetical protein
MPTFGNLGGFTSASNPTGAADYGAATADIFGTAGSAIQAYGSFQAQGAYKESAATDIEEAGLALQKSKIQEAQIGRELSMQQGQATSTITSNGFELGGSGLDILRMNASQGALAQATTGEEGLIQQQAYMQQASAAKAAANQAGIAGIAGGVEAVGMLALAFA